MNENIIENSIEGNNIKRRVAINTIDFTSRNSTRNLKSEEIIVNIIKYGQIVLLIVAVILLIKVIINIKKKKKFGLPLFFCVVSFAIPTIISIIKGFAIAAKPIIYLYPEKKEKVKVKFQYPEKLICTYPKYKEQWEVMAEPSGDLVDCETGRKLYALYWEGNRNSKPKIEQGFCVKGEDSINFLEEKLALLGLNEREAEEFIVYWLPKVEKNPYNLIKFELTEDVNINMPLEINPKPDTLIRVIMVFKKVQKFVEIEPQKIITPERKGFTVVEWGGTRIQFYKKARERENLNKDKIVLIGFFLILFVF